MKDEKDQLGKVCLNCAYPIDRYTYPVDRSAKDAEGKLKLVTSETGKCIYYAILDHNFRSIDLCNWCYSIMRAYRHSLSKEEREYMEVKLEKIIGEG